jgi:hypothetical protein
MGRIPPWSARPRSHCALPASGRALAHLLQLSRDIYNGALQHRRDAWHITRNSSAPISISRFDQFNEVKELKEVCPAVGRFGITPVRGAISRVDEAFGAFFRRVKNGETPGYPRFKSRARFRTIFYDTPTGWHLRGVTPRPPRKDGRPAKVVAAALYVQGVGDIALGQGAVRQLRRHRTRWRAPHLDHHPLQVRRLEGLRRVQRRGPQTAPRDARHRRGGPGHLGHRCSARRLAAHVPTIPQGGPDSDRRFAAPTRGAREVLPRVEEDQQGCGQDLRQGASALGELGPPLRYRDRRPLWRDLPRGPAARQHGQVGQGDQRIPGERSRTKEGTEQELAGRRTVSTGLLDLREGGRGRTQGMEGESEGFVERVHCLWAHRSVQPVPCQIQLPQVRA